jgi:hypothetical protein
LLGAAVMVALGCARGGDAALLSGVLPGVVSTPAAAYCDTNVSQPFARWGDMANYALAPGGSFESGTPSWSLGNGAKVVAGNEPFYVHSRSDSRSLSIPGGGTAATPTMCYAFGDWKLRLFASSSGTASYSRLQVSVVARNLTGVLSVLDSASLTPAGAWGPTNPVALTVTNLCGLIATDSVSFRFAAIGPGSWRIDDVYLDPWKDP